MAGRRFSLAYIRAAAGNREGAASLHREAADHGNPGDMNEDVRMRREHRPLGLDPDGTPTSPRQSSTEQQPWVSLRAGSDDRS